jgi:hypothetical protein
MLSIFVNNIFHIFLSNDNKSQEVSNRNCLDCI